MQNVCANSFKVTYATATNEIMMGQGPYVRN